jgi:heme A synthase
VDQKEIIVTTLTLDRRRASDGLVRLAVWGAIAGALLQVVLGILLASLEAQGPPSAAPWRPAPTGLAGSSKTWPLVE